MNSHHTEQIAIKRFLSTLPNMKYLNNLAEFDALVGHETNLIVIDFTATWYVHG